MNKRWKKFKEEWDLKSILLFGIPFLFVISFFLCAFLADAQLRSGNQKFVLFDGTRPINLYAGSVLISQHNSPPAITAFSASPSTIDLDTRASGTITFTIGVTGTAGTTTPTASNITFFNDTAGSGFFENRISISSRWSSIGSRAVANNNLLRLQFGPSDVNTTILRNKYAVYFYESFLKTKTPINLEVSGNSYNLSYFSLAFTNPIILRYSSTIIPSSDRVTDSNLTKSINFEFINNRQITLDIDLYTFQKIQYTDQTLTSISYYSADGSLPANARRKWVFWIPNSITKTPSNIIINGRNYPVTFWQNNVGLGKGYFTTNQVTDTGFIPNSSNLTFGINIKFTDGTYLYNTRTWLYNTVSGGTTNAQIVQLPNGTNIGTTFTAGAGANISTTLPNILQPQQTTTYRLFATNSGGSSHRDTTVTVTKNPTLTNCRRIGSITRPGFTNYTFGFTLTGLPRPTVTYVFSGGQTGTVSTSHYQQGSNPYTWTASNWVVTMPNANAQSLVLTARNASGSTTCTLSNINN